MRNENDKLLRLNRDDYVFIILIIATIMSIYGNQKQKEFFNFRDIQDIKKSQSVYLTALIITLGVYLYFAYNSYIDYKNASEENKDILFVRFIANIFFIIGIIVLIYFRINDPNAIGGPPI